MIFTIISILILLLGCLNFKQGLIIFVTYQIFWYPTEVISIGTVSLNTSVMLSLGYSILYLLHKSRYKVSKKSFPYTIPFIFIIISYIASCFFALSGFSIELARAVRYILQDYVMVGILWNTMETKKDFRMLFNGITMVIFICCIYGLIEYFTGINFMLDYKVALSDDTLVTYGSTGLRGYRLVSLFEHPIGAGMTLALYAAIVLNMWIEKKYIPNKILSLMTAVMCIPCVFLTKMRTAILFAIITCAFSLINKKSMKKKRSFYILIAVCACVPIFVFVFQDYIGLLSNMFSIDTSSIGGSSLSMRVTQMEAIRNIIKESPIFGFGETFRSSIIRSVYTDAALGYEGLWNEKLIMHGAFGIIATIVLIYYSVYKVPKKYHCRVAALFAFAYWCVYTFSSIPSFRMTLFFLAEFYFIKMSDAYRSVDQTCLPKKQIEIISYPSSYKLGQKNKEESI